MTSIWVIVSGRVHLATRSIANVERVVPTGEMTSIWVMVSDRVHLTTRSTATLTNHRWGR